jgi:hypothetical protein
MRRIDDTTASVAVGNLSGERVIRAVRLIDSEFDRALLIAHVGLEVPLSTLARNLKVERRELAMRLERTLGMLPDQLPLELFRDIGRAGRREHYQELALRLNLQQWFCAYCGDMMVLRGAGRPRNTCSDACRLRLYRAGGLSWKNRYERTPVQRGVVGPARGQPQTVLSTADGREKLRALLGPVSDSRRYNVWLSNEERQRDQAMMLLGFACPIHVTPGDLAALDANDVCRTEGGLEVRLFKRDARATQYVTLARDRVRERCPVETTLAWRSCRMAGQGDTASPLFVKLTEGGHLPGKRRRISGMAIAGLVNWALGYVDHEPIDAFTPSQLFADFLERLELAPKRVNHVG